MRAALKLECIGDNHARQNAAWRGTLFDAKLPRPWVAKLSIKNGKLDRDFLSGQKDYSESNSKGSRGVMLFFWLESGCFYEINQLLSWKSQKRWFCFVTPEGKITEVEKYEVEICLS